MEWAWEYSLLIKFFGIIGFISVANCCVAQIESTTDPILENDEILNENIENNEEITIKYKNKVYLAELLNDVELSSLYLTKPQIEAIRNHVQQTGRVLDLVELQTLVNIEYNTYIALCKLIKFEDEYYNISTEKVKFYSRYTYQSKEIENAIGSNWANYQQLKVRIGNKCNVAIAREYDVGENYNKTTLINYYDHYAFYMQYLSNRFEIGIGNFQIYQGFGLLMGQGFSGGFGAGGINNIIQHRWMVVANQSEYNTSQGFYYLQRVKNIQINIGLNAQKIDDGNTFGSHRTATELKKKDKLNERLLIIGIEKNARTNHHGFLVIQDLIEKNTSLSYSNQFYYRNLTAFSELVHHTTGNAYSIGLAIMLNKDVQVSLSNTNYIKEFESKWAASNVQGFNVNDGNGYAINVSFPFKRKWNVNLTHRVNFKTENNADKIGRSIENTELIRVDRIFSKQLKITVIYLFKNENLDGTNSEKLFTKNDENRLRISVKQSVNEHVNQELYFHRNALNKISSLAILYQLEYKQKKWKLMYSIGMFDINNGPPIYASTNNVILARNTVAVYDNGVVQNIGWQWKHKKKFHFAIQYTSAYNSINRESNYKILSSIKYP